MRMRAQGPQARQVLGPVSVLELGWRPQAFARRALRVAELELAELRLNQLWRRSSRGRLGQRLRTNEFHGILRNSVREA